MGRGRLRGGLRASACPYQPALHAPAAAALRATDACLGRVRRRGQAPTVGTCRVGRGCAPAHGAARAVLGSGTRRHQMVWTWLSTITATRALGPYSQPLCWAMRIASSRFGLPSGCRSGTVAANRKPPPRWSASSRLLTARIRSARPRNPLPSRRRSPTAGLTLADRLCQHRVHGIGRRALRRDRGLDPGRGQGRMCALQLAGEGDP
jgi:hypothetical protein